MPKLMLFPLIFSRFFLMTFFLLAKLFSHISCKNALKPINIYHMSHLPYPKYFSLPAWWKHIREFPAMANGQKSKLLGGGWRSNIGGMYHPHPPGFAALLSNRRIWSNGEIGIRYSAILRAYNYDGSSNSISIRYHKTA